MPNCTIQNWFEVTVIEFNTYILANYNNAMGLGPAALFEVLVCAPSTPSGSSFCHLSRDVS